MLVLFSLILAAALTAVDQLLKQLVVLQLKPGRVVTVIPNLLTLFYSENRGAAFGMLANHRWVFIVVTVVLMAACLWALLTRYRRNAFACLALALILSGGLANMIDRVLQGYVVDYIFISFFPAVFNFADCCVVIGAIMALIGLFVAERRAHKKAA